MQIRCKLVFPKTRDPDALFAEQSRNLSMSLAIPVNLCRPEFLMRFRNVTASLTTMPKAPVHENRESGGLEIEIRFSWQINALFAPSGYARSDQCHLEPQLCRLVAASSHCGHCPGALN